MRGEPALRCVDRGGEKWLELVSRTQVQLVAQVRGPHVALMRCSKLSSRCTCGWTISDSRISSVGQKGGRSPTSHALISSVGGISSTNGIGSNNFQLEVSLWWHLRCRGSPLVAVLRTTDTTSRCLARCSWRGTFRASLCPCILCCAGCPACRGATEQRDPAP